MGEILHEIADLFVILATSLYWGVRKKYHIKDAWQIEHEQYNDYARKAGLPEIDIKNLMKDRFIE